MKNLNFLGQVLSKEELSLVTGGNSYQCQEGSVCTYCYTGYPGDTGSPGCRTQAEINSWLWAFPNGSCKVGTRTVCPQP